MPEAAGSAASTEFGKKPNIAVDKDLLRHSSLSHSSWILCFEVSKFSAFVRPPRESWLPPRVRGRSRWLPSSPALRIVEKVFVTHNMCPDEHAGRWDFSQPHTNSKVHDAGVLRLSLRHARVF